MSAWRDGEKSGWRGWWKARRQDWKDSRREARQRSRPPFDPEAWRAIRHGLPLLADLDDADAERLGPRAWQLLQRKRWVAGDDVELDQPGMLAIAAQAELLTLGWSDRDASAAFDNVTEIILLPDSFHRHVEEMDDFGVMHEYVDERAGETSWRGPVVLAVPDVAESGDYTGFNVIIHEFAHKLDLGNSQDIDGFPPLAAASDVTSKEWHRVFTAVWDDLQAHIERGEDTPIDDYAATHPGECFTVCCELFFSAPDQLAATYPDLLDLLNRYFRQEPLARFEQRQPSGVDQP
ncbi:zinc-dependent peptidase [Salinicola halophyticus]|uniref:M90 family metallopeptidase n=1 Tax=Salinicola halophyticus TaxID=1808881 RepID=UPI000DA1F854|nr:M90 family metallopeptidase [Salinicola halophyticus]